MLLQRVRQAAGRARDREQRLAGPDDLAFAVVQLCTEMTGRPLTDDELRFIAAAGDARRLRGRPAEPGVLRG